MLLRRERLERRRAAPCCGGQLTEGSAAVDSRPAPSSDDGAGVKRFSGSGFFAAAEEKPGLPGAILVEGGKRKLERAPPLLRCSPPPDSSRRGAVAANEKAPVLVPAPGAGVCIGEEREEERGRSASSLPRDLRESTRGLARDARAAAGARPGAPGSSLPP